jgi:hypothetical protein
MRLCRGRLAGASHSRLVRRQALLVWQVKRQVIRTWRVRNSAFRGVRGSKMAQRNFARDFAFLARPAGLRLVVGFELL